MAIQCTTCRTETRNGAKFCHACGTPIATAALPSTLPLGAVPPIIETPSAPPPTATAPQKVAATEAINMPSAYLPQAPQTYHAPPPVAPLGNSKKSGNTLKIVLISFAIILVLGIASVIGAVYFISQKASRTIADLKKNIPTVTHSKEKVSEDKLRVPVYPGARQEDAVMGSLGPMSGGVVTFTTSDDPETVAEFYREHFNNQKNLKFSEISEEGKEAVFQVNTDDGPRFLTISPGKKDQTEIVVILGKGIPDLPAPPPPPPPPPGGASYRKAQELERRALEQADKLKRDLELALPPPPPAPKH